MHKTTVLTLPKAVLNVVVVDALLPLIKSDLVDKIRNQIEW